MGALENGERDRPQDIETFKPSRMVVLGAGSEPELDAAGASDLAGALGHRAHAASGHPRPELVQVAGRPARISPWSLSASGSVPTALRDNLRIRASIGEWQQWRNYAIWPMKPVVVPTKGKSGSGLAVASYQKQICSRLVPVGSTAVNQDI